MSRIPYSGLPAHRLLFYTIGWVPPRINTILHSGFVLRQPPPHHIHASDFSQARWYPDQPRNFSALRRYVGRIRSSLQGRCQPINKLRRPTAFVQRTGKTTSAGLRSVRLRGKRSRLWHGQLGIEPTTHGFGDRVATLVHVPAYCSLRAEPKPRPSGKEGGKEKEWRCRVCPCISHDKVRFFNFSTFKWNFQKLFFGNIYHAGIVRPAHQIVH